MEPRILLSASAVDHDPWDAADPAAGGHGNPAAPGLHLEGTRRDDALAGGAGNDRLNGNDGNDALRGAGGDDILRGNKGDDLLRGGDGDDVLRGGKGDDILRGDGGDDLLRGGKGDDVLRGGAGNDVLVGGHGRDTADYGDAASGVTVDLTLTSAQDTGGAGVDRLTGIEKVHGSDHDDVFAFGAPKGGATYDVDGDSGINVIDLRNFDSSEATVDLVKGTITVDLPGAGHGHGHGHGPEHFTIRYENIAILRFADTNMILDNVLVDAGDDVTAAAGAQVSLDASGSSLLQPSEDHSEIVKLLPSDGGAGDYHGFSVAIDGDLAAVGAYRADDGGTDAGSVYLYRKVDSAWTEVAHLRAPDGDGADYFGYSVAVSDGTVIVGAIGDEGSGDLSGSAYIFRETAAGWTPVAKLVAADGAPGDIFGVSVAVSGNVALVGASRDDDGGDGSGSAYVFEDGGSGWVQTAKLVASDAEAGDHFGHNVAVSGGSAIIGCYGDDSAGTDSGSAYIYEKAGGEWREMAKLTASDSAPSAAFGYSVGIAGDTAVVGAVLDGGGAGAAYIFQRGAEGWVQSARLESPEPGSDRFGISVGVDGDRVVVGAMKAGTAGAVTIFRETPVGWIQVDEIHAPSADSYFGVDVSNSAETVIVGAPRSGDLGNDAGAAHIYERELPPLTYSWTQVSGPAVALSDPAAASPTFTVPPGAAGAELVFQVTVSDGVHSSTDTVTVAVDEAKPVAAAAPKGSAKGR